jgi:hypothetical protein
MIHPASDFICHLRHWYPNIPDEAGQTNSIPAHPESEHTFPHRICFGMIGFCMQAVRVAPSRSPCRGLECVLYVTMLSASTSRGGFRRYKEHSRRNDVGKAAMRR